jgi:hypothetical protein
MQSLLITWRSLEFKSTCSAKRREWAMQSLLNTRLLLATWWRSLESKYVCGAGRLRLSTRTLTMAKKQTSRCV